MDQALIRFRQAAARANRDRQGLQRRYSNDCSTRRWSTCARGSNRATACVRSPPRSGSRRGASIAGRVRLRSADGFTRCRSWPPPRPGHGAPVVIMSADGLRVEGLDVNAAAQLLRLLR